MTYLVNLKLGPAHTSFNLSSFGTTLYYLDLIDVIDDDRGDSDDLSGAGGHHSHQDKEEDGVLPGGPEQLLGHEGRGEALGDVV